ncbi:MAG: hypothetical protein GWP56_15130 [Gammaproteobacteria bacterium]|jgi:hypothetical protein|nr:hypothetical protein [Gammaproteobacteria bacterium]
MPGFGCWLFLALSWDIYTLREIPEEAIHVSEYGILGLLVYRALTHRVRDFSIYLMAALVVAMIGVIDEYIQWLTPSRVFDLRDIRTNAIAGALSQLAIFLGLRPSIIHGMPAAINWSRLCYLGIAALALLALGFMNTPQRIAWYATNLPPLAYLMDSKSVMVEYGYRYEDPDTGIFRSRFSEAQLQRLDQQRGAEVAGILDRYIRGIGYREFQSIYTVPRDAYAHEAGVHLFRREFHLDRARENSPEKQHHYQVAYRENQILKKYFSTALNHSRHDWNPETEREVEPNADKTFLYESAVSKGLITSLSQSQVLALFAAVSVLLWLVGVRLRRAGRSTQT